MTCLLALENSQLTNQVTMTETGVSGVTDGGAHISSQLGEVFTMEQCLYALMLASANDIALQVAEQIGGSVDAFVQKMNDRARELVCTNTVFTNPTGLPDDNQHTTAHDLALIMQAAISNDSFRTISGATSYTIPATNVSGGTRNLTSSFTMTDLHPLLIIKDVSADVKVLPLLPEASLSQLLSERYYSDRCSYERSDRSDSQ